MATLTASDFPAGAFQKIIVDEAVVGVRRCVFPFMAFLFVDPDLIEGQPSHDEEITPGEYDMLLSMHEDALFLP